MSRGAKLGTVKAPAPSPGLIGYYPAFQSASDPSPQIDRIEDRSGRGNHSLLGTDAVRATAWGTASRWTSVDANAGTTFHGARIPAATINWNKGTESLLIAGKFNGAAGSNRYPFGFGGASGTTIHGFVLRANSAGTCRLQSVTPSGLGQYNDSTSTLLNGADHSFLIAFDGLTKRAFGYFDGAFDAAFNGSVLGLDIAPALASMTTFGDLTWGGYPHTPVGTKNLVWACTMYGMQVAKRTGGLPTNIAEVARRLHTQPMQPLTRNEWPE